MHVSRRILFTLVFVLLFNVFFMGGRSLATSTINPEDNYHDFINRLEKDVPKLLKKYRVPGTAIGVIHKGEVSWSKGFGLADKSEAISVDTETVFQVASISKTVTAWGVMKLVEEAKIDLDDPVDKYLTRWKLPDSEYKDKITVRGLLSHTAGLSVGGYAGYGKLPTSDIEDSLAGETYRGYRVYSQREPKTRFQYSGGGYSILQLLIEEVSGVSFEVYMKDEILIPLGMKNSSFVWTPDLEPNLAKPYGVFGETLPNYLFVEKAAAGLYTTVEDLTNFLLASMGGGNGKQVGMDLLKEDTIKKMTTPTILKNGTKINYGLGYFVNKLPNGSKTVLHGGDNIGWRALMMGNPSKGEGLIILTNSYRGNHLINEIEGYWVEFQTGSGAGFLRNIKAKEGKIKLFTTGLLILFFLFFSRLIFHLKSGKRKSLSKQTMKHKWVKWLQLISSSLIVIGWWIGFYSPWYQNGWTIAAFLPLGFGWITATVTIGGLYFGLSALFPKGKERKL